MQILLNTEILQRVRNWPHNVKVIVMSCFLCLSVNVSVFVYGLQDSSSVIQFVTRGHVQLDDRAVEVSAGLPEEISVSDQMDE